MKHIIIIFILSTLLFSKVPEIVPLSWLKSHLHDSSLVLIDVRSAEEYKKGHLQNAVNIPVFDKLFYGETMIVPPLSNLKKIFSEAGIDDKSQIVVYCGENPIWSARFYWISKVLGADDVGILKVNYGNWGKGTFKVSTKNFHAKYRDFIPKINNNILKTKLDILTSMKNSYIIDGRPKAFYVGEKSHAKRAGHIPKSLNIPGNLNYNLHGTKRSIKDFQNLAKIYKHLDVKKPIILYCEDGADAAMNYLVLKKLGYNASVYDGSWLEWGNSNLPIEKGEVGVK
jgi:thiosulfate/3-mercaptopyruvate sulfurtransferase